MLARMIRAQTWPCLWDLTLKCPLDFKYVSAILSVIKHFRRRSLSFACLTWSVCRFGPPVLLNKRTNRFRCFQIFSFIKTKCRLKKKNPFKVSTEFMETLICRLKFRTTILTSCGKLFSFLYFFLRKFSTEDVRNLAYHQILYKRPVKLWAD